MLACVEMLLVVIALHEVKPVNLAEQDAVAEVIFGLLSASFPAGKVPPPGLFLFKVARTIPPEGKSERERP